MANLAAPYFSKEFLRTTVVGPLFKKESHFFMLAVGLILLTTTYMHYWFPKEWASTPEALRFVEFIASTFPALRSLQQMPEIYTPYWGVFYAVQWCLVPAEIILGFWGTFFLTEFRYQRLIVEASWRILMFIFIVGFLLCLEYSFSPQIPGGGSSRLQFNPHSFFYPVVAVAWSINGLIYYFFGRLSGAVFIRCGMKFF